MGWYKAVKGKLYTRRDTTKTPASNGAPPRPSTSATPASSTAVESTAAAHYEMKDNTVIVWLFASWCDPYWSKTFPALFGLFRQGYLPTDVKIVGYARTKMEKADFHSRAVSYIKNPDKDAEISASIQKFQDVLTYVDGSYDEGAAFDALNAHISDIEAKYTSEERNRLFYLALPPSVFIPVAKNIKEHCYSETGVNRIIVEKPFGKDLDFGARAYWSEEETYRIDHYLGKEMVKNILVLRFANVAMGAIWDKTHISNVQITFKEPFGTEGRGGYFNEFGIIRDVLQNHLLQVLSVITMERPVSFEAEDVRNEKAADGKPGYLEDDTVPRGSLCPTFAATTLWVNTPRWEGVPFILKAGKALNEAKVEVRIQFKDVTQGIFKEITRNELVIRIQPSEAVYLKMNLKSPGLQTRAIATEMDLTYNRRFADAKIPEAYEALILDALQGDHSNFVRHDELDVAWKIFTPILHWIDGQNGTRPKPLPYGYGSRGPSELNAFIERFGYQRTAAS
ncbi:glucose-6-P dehydrogenase [Mycena metata]|uniref:Glucose-6-phosphate 1-dehydrogenase n=1 Tax=Mycena metata TaxID=1033252 RepID=A0AAD7KBM2_9AGAR|nr:glucose-6-P dehydrogenase [Mycena metata]